MDDASNGSLKGGKTANGVNGNLKPSANGHAVGSNKRRTKAGPSLLARALSIVARLLTWYSILSILFRCPPALEACDESSPRICKPYFRLKQVVSPHLEPYYDTYAAPYVELARPYYDTLDKNVVSPGWAYATKHGKPLIVQGQIYGQAQWDKSVQPLLAKYQALAEAQYEQTLAPHVNQVSSTVGPYYEIARTNALQTYHELLLPTYEYVRPYAQQGYSAASAFTTDVAVPSAIWTWNKTYIFLDSTVWPQLRVIYIENVEPQLVKIGQRLGRYSERKPGQKQTAESSAKSVRTASTAPSSLTESSTGGKSASSSSFAKPAPSASSSSSVDPTEPAEPSAVETEAQTPPPGAEVPTQPPPADTTRGRAEPVPAPEYDPNEDEDEVRRVARETVAEDLKGWQERYAKAADEGAAEIEERVEEISKRMIRRNAKTTGKALLEKLQSTVVSELITLRRQILSIIGAVAKGSATRADGEEQVVTVVRQAGMAIRETAQDVRSWREKYEAEVQGSITEAASQHFMILDGIRDLALQKIGMKWAWMEGVTYKDWAKYHLLKDRFDEWEEDLKHLIVSHPGLAAAQNAGADVEDEAMKVASAAAKELGRLKQVALWKLTAADETDEFDSDLMKQAAEAAESARLAAENASIAAESATTSEEAALPEASVASESLESENLDSEPGSADIPPSPASVESEASTSPSTTAETDTVASDELPTTSEAASAPGSSSTPSLAEESTVESVASHSTAKESLESVDTATSSVIEKASASATTATREESKETPELAATPILADPVMENIVELDDDKLAPVNVASDSELEEPIIEPPVAEAPLFDSTASVKPALFGAAAQAVPDRQPILDDEVEDLPSSIAAFAQSAYSAAMSRADKQYSQALAAVSAQIHGTPEPVQQQMLASVTSAYSNALASASSRFSIVLKEAHEQIYGTPTKKVIPTPAIPSLPTVDWARIESMAVERLQQGRLWAEEQYESAKIAVGLATPTPSTPTEHINRVLENARHNYFAGLGVAHARYSEFLAAASSAISSMTATPTPTPTDMAGSISSAASVVSENISSAVDKAAENWEVLVTKISIQIYGAPTPTPWYQSVYSAAAEKASAVTSAAGSYASAAQQDATNQYESVSSIVNELLVGKDPTFVEGIFSRLQAVYSAGAESVEYIASDASDAAKTAGSKVASAASEATEVAKEKVAQVKDEL